MKRSRQVVVALIASILVSSSVEAVHALTISVSGQGVTAAQAAESTFLTGLSQVVTESFEGYSAVNPAVKPPSFVTSVGTFTQILPGYGGGCEPTTCTDLS